MSHEEHLRVLVADERQKYLTPVSEAVEALGHEVCAHEVEIAAVARRTVDLRPDIAIVALHEDTEHALRLISEIVDEATCPVVALADDAGRDFVTKAADRGVFAYIDSTRPAELEGAIDVALQRYRQFATLLDAFARRARIERAKGILIERHSIDEREAFERLRRKARNERRPLVEVADELVASRG